jgi:hypothetical protein
MDAEQVVGGGPETYYADCREKPPKKMRRLSRCDRDIRFRDEQVWYQGDDSLWVMGWLVSITGFGDLAVIDGVDSKRHKVTLDRLEERWQAKLRLMGFKVGIK